MWGSTRPVTHEQTIDAAPEKVWALVAAPAALTAMPGPRFAFPVPDAVPGTDRLCFVLVAGPRGVDCAVVDVREEVPGQLICWQARSRQPTGPQTLTMTLSVRPRQGGCTLGFVVGGSDPRMSQVERRNWLHTTLAWAGSLRKIAEGEEPWPPADLPAGVREACAPPQRPGKTVQGTGAALINAAAETVWEMVWAPETSRLIEPDTVAWAGTVPGTPPRAVGEMQCTVERKPDDRFAARVYIVSELTWGRRAVTQHVGGSLWEEVEHLVTPTDGGTRLELTARGVRKAGAARVADAMARHTQAVADGYKEVIEKAAGTPPS